MADKVKLTKVAFEGERQRYTVQAANGRFAIMTKPFNARKTYLYTIVDLKRGVRGRCNLIFGPPCAVNTPEGASEALGYIERGEMEVSYRRYKPLSEAEITSVCRALRLSAITPLGLSLIGGAEGWSL